MILLQALDRYRAHLGQFLLISLVAALLSAGIPLLVFMVLGGMGAAMALAGGALGSDPGVILALLGAAVVGTLLALLAAWLLGALGYGMQCTAARDALTGQPVSLGRALAGAGQCWGRVVGYSLLIFLPQMVLTAVAAISFLGWLLYLLSLLVLPPTFLYGLYALVAEDLSVSAALGRVWAGLTRRFGEHVLAGLVMLGIALTLGLVSALLALIPIAGWVAAALLFFAGIGFLPVYFGLRYQRNVRPYLEEQGPPVPPFPQGPTA